MAKPCPRILALSALIVLPLVSCSRPSIRDQLNFGIWAAERNMWDEAVFRWKKVLAADSGSAAAHNNLAVAYEKKGLWEEARKEYEAALKIDPDNQKIKYNLNKHKEALEPPKKNDKEKNEKK